MKAYVIKFLDPQNTKLVCNCNLTFLILFTMLDHGCYQYVQIQKKFSH